MDTNAFLKFREKIKSNISKVIMGKDEIIDLITISFICDGHVLLEDIPGMGKTTMIKAFATSLGSQFKRIQFTPDLMPSDLTGINFYNQKLQDFEFRKGPLFGNIILADEINRATPRTQSSLLEAMEEKQITVDGVTRSLGLPFMVLATQNPVESYGTFPLPEAQMDRFFMRLQIGYPDRENEKNIMKLYKDSVPMKDIRNVVTEEEIKYVRENYSRAKVSEDVYNYIMDIIEATRNHKDVAIGASPRGTMALLKASQGAALIEERDFVIPEDVKKMAPYVLNHRIVYKGLKKSRNMYGFIEEILENVEVPLEARV